MANPQFVDCPKDVWTLVATNVVTGQLWRAELGARYLHTYRDTGDAAPTLRDEGMPIFVDTEKDVETISATLGIDVYVYAANQDGRVRVDL